MCIKSETLRHKPRPSYPPISAFPCVFLSADWLTGTSAARAQYLISVPVASRRDSASSLLGRGRAAMEQNHISNEQQLFAGFKTAFKSFATEAIHVGQEPEQWTSMAVVPPISLSTTFKQDEPGKHAVSNLVIFDAGMTTLASLNPRDSLC